MPMNREKFLDKLNTQAAKYIMGMHQKDGSWVAEDGAWLPICDWHPCSRRQQSDLLVAMMLERKDLLAFQLLEDYIDFSREYSACFIDRHYERQFVTWDRKACVAIVEAVLKAYGLVKPGGEEIC